MAVINFEVSKNTTNGDMFKKLFPDADVQEIRGHFGNTLLGYRTRCGERSQDLMSKDRSEDKK